MSLNSCLRYDGIERNQGWKKPWVQWYEKGAKLSVTDYESWKGLG